MTQEGKYNDPSSVLEDQPLKFILEVRLGDMTTLADVARVFANAVNNYGANCDVLEECDGMNVVDPKSGEVVGSWTVQEVHS